MKYFAFLFLTFIAISFNHDKNNIDKNEPFVVLQLFTSQGCSSCPKADAFLEIIKKEYAKKNVIVMSYHVDYWNSLGWKDPFSKKEFSNLQYKYGKALKADNVYTPQVVINGKKDFIGSYKNEIRKNIAKNLEEKATNNVELTNISKVKNSISFHYKVNGNIKGKQLQIALVLENKITKVKRGENTNRTISNSNIVVQTFSEKNIDSAGKITIQIPEKYATESALRIIGFVQNSNLQISGATQIKI